MDSLISTFHIDWHLIIAQAVNFVVVILVLWHFALKPLGKLMDERGKTIAGGLDNAKKQEELLKAQKAEYDATLAQARSEASAIMQSIKKEAETKRTSMLTTAEDEVKATIDAGRRQLESEKQKMLADAKTELAELVIQVSAKVFEEGMTPKIDHAVVVENIKTLNS